MGPGAGAAGKLAADIAALTAKAEAADAEDIDPQALPAEIARREAFKKKLETACARLEADKAEAEAECPEYEARRRPRRPRPGGRPAAQTARQQAAGGPANQPDRSQFAADAQVQGARIPPSLQRPGGGLRRGDTAHPGHRHGHHAERPADLRGHGPGDARHGRPAADSASRCRLCQRPGRRRTRSLRYRALGGDRPHHRTGPTTFARRPSPSPSAASPNRGAWR